MFFQSAKNAGQWSLGTRLVHSSIESNGVWLLVLREYTLHVRPSNGLGYERRLHLPDCLVRTPSGGRGMRLGIEILSTEHTTATNSTSVLYQECNS